MYKDFIIKNYSKTIDEMLNEGLTFKQINEAVKSPKNFCKTFQDFLDEMPALHCMFKEYIEDEASGLIKNIKDFVIVYDDYFRYNWGAGWVEVENGVLTEEEIEDDQAELDDFICSYYQEVAEVLDFNY